MIRLPILLSSFFGIAVSSLPVLGSQSFDGSLEFQHRQFFESGDYDQSKGQSSVALSLNYLKDWNNGDDRLEVETFWRVDDVDNERTHADLRQLIWTHYGDNYEFSAGLGRVFWGVTETQHLVDVVNQTDLVENIDGEDKLGQPLLRYQRFTEVGTFELFLLPYFRTRTFEGSEGRLNGGLRVLSDDPVYESNSGSSSLDTAFRYTNTLGAFDFGLSWFSGTSREPELFSNIDFLNGSTRPFYPQVDQYGLDVQFTEGGWLLKLEAIQRNFDVQSIEDHAAATLGFEYTLVGVFGSTYDLGLLGEYSWDDRGTRATTTFQDDLFLGARLALNDVSSSEVLFGVSEDLEFSGSKAVFLEGATRINNAVSLNVEARYFDADSDRDPLFSFKDSSFIQVGIEYFFD
ncbi:hypothetical protein NBRC116583_13250 [Arenicella sp. 4NH20-0111]|uniref:hypothetical protein n=1 Tax=Arenicella sp. 4NH20-0111 TaxID=3127648 RepID=UPI003105C2F9